MIEHRITLKPVEVHKICDCGGEFKFDGNVLPSYPTQYPHTCDKCKAKVVLNKVYPCIEYEKSVRNKN